MKWKCVHSAVTERNLTMGKCVENNWSNSIFFSHNFVNKTELRIMASQREPEASQHLHHTRMSQVESNGMRGESCYLQGCSKDWIHISEWMAMGETNSSLSVTGNMCLTIGNLIGRSTDKPTDCLTDWLGERNWLCHTSPCMSTANLQLNFPSFQRANFTLKILKQIKPGRNEEWRKWNEKQEKEEENEGGGRRRKKALFLFHLVSAMD